MGGLVLDGVLESWIMQNKLTDLRRTLQLFRKREAQAVQQLIQQMFDQLWPQWQKKLNQLNKLEHISAAALQLRKSMRLSVNEIVASVSKQWTDAVADMELDKALSSTHALPQPVVYSSSV